MKPRTFRTMKAILYLKSDTTVQTVLSFVRQFSTLSTPVLSLRLLVSGVLLLLLRLCRLSMSPLRRGRCRRRYSCIKTSLVLKKKKKIQLIKAALQARLRSFNNRKPFVCFTKPECVWCNVRWSRLAPNRALEANNDLLSGAENFPCLLDLLRYAGMQLNNPFMCLTILRFNFREQLRF